MTKIRPEPEYFRVGYYGLGFPSFLQASSTCGVIISFVSFVVNSQASVSILFELSGCAHMHSLTSVILLNLLSSLWS